MAYSIRKNFVQTLIIAAGFGVAFLFLVVPNAHTYPPYLAKAKALGYPAKDCTYCHVNATGGEPYGPRGKWLIAEKERRGASSVDVAWLKEYKEDAPKEPEKKQPDPQQTKANTAQPVSSRATASGNREPVRALSGQLKGNEIAARLGNDRPGFNYVITGVRIVDNKLQLQGTIKPAAADAVGGTATATLIGTLSRARNPWPSANDEEAVTPRKKPAAADAANKTTGPAPSAGQTQQQGRETRNPENTAQLGSLAQSTQPTAHTTQTPTAPQGQKPTAAGEANEQNQSLFGAANVGLGCEIFYLKMQLPEQVAAMAQTGGEPVQIGVVLAPMDNKRGVDINNQLCRVVHAMRDAKSDDAQTQVAELNRLLAGGAAAASGSANSGGGK